MLHIFTSFLQGCFTFVKPDQNLEWMQVDDVERSGEEQMRQRILIMAYILSKQVVLCWCVFWLAKGDNKKQCATVNYYCGVLLIFSRVSDRVGGVFVRCRADVKPMSRPRRAQARANLGQVLSPRPSARVLIARRLLDFYTRNTIFAGTREAMVKPLPFFFLQY